MGFDAAHAISCLAKLALRISRNTRSREEDGFFGWLDAVLAGGLPAGIKAINFNLYDDGGGKWSVELVGTSAFDESSSDWACREVYATRTNPYVLTKDGDWKAIEALFASLLQKYLAGGKYSDVLKQYSAVGMGFVDGDLHILYKNPSEKQAAHTDAYLGRDEIFRRLGHEDSPELLRAISQLEKVDFRDDEGTTYLHIAALHHRTQVIKILFEKGADPNWRDNKGWLPILYALGRKNEDNPEILKQFLEYGLNLELETSGGQTVGETIASFGDPKLDEVIREFEPPCPTEDDH